MVKAIAIAAADERHMRMDFGSGLSCLRLALFGAVFCDAPDVLASISFSRLRKTSPALYMVSVVWLYLSRN